MRMVSNRRPRGHSTPLLPLASMIAVALPMAFSFTPQRTISPLSQRQESLPRTAALSMSDPQWRNDPTGSDPNQWRSADDDYSLQEDWQEVLARKNDGSFWSDFDSTDEETMKDLTNKLENDEDQAEVVEAWLNTLASISAEEVEFNMVEANRADKAREMQEWGFDSETIKNTFGIAVDDSLEKDDVEGMKAFRDASYWEEEDWKIVESHTKVEKDPETGEPVRQQMVYVDEHTCIGCTNCATVAQSTFFMNDEHGRARVFQQWGDDDETIQIAIETCPVDCIHYVPYDELVALELDRRNQNINFKARLVSQAEYGNTLSHKVGGSGFTAPQQISGNMKARCNNCPSRGCKTCPMFGVGKNPEFERKEKERLARIERRRLEQQRAEEKKSVDL